MNPTAPEFLRQPCSCQGNNENCFKCGGWGYIDKIGAGRATPVAHGVDGTVPSSVRSRRRDGLSMSASRPSSSRAVYVCEICKARVTRISRHLRRAHGEIEAVPATTQVTDHAKIGKVLTSCPHCAAMVRRDRMKSHILRVHQISDIDHASVQKRRSGAQSEARVLGNEIDNERSQRALDATRDYYAAYRDHGQFGSHPSHDGFDDESEP